MEIQEFTCDFYELFVWLRSIEMINIDTSKDKFNVLIGDRSFLFSYHVCFELFFHPLLRIFRSSNCKFLVHKTAHALRGLKNGRLDSR